MIVGDRYSQICARTFNELIEETSYSLGPQHTARVMIQKSLNQVIHIPGDLHGGCFHFYSDIYALYYGYIIQPIQALLGWKHIKGFDVTNCHQQTAGLGIMIRYEMERHIITMYAKSIDNNPIQKARFVQIKNPQEAGIYLENGFTTWIGASCTTTNNK